MNIQEYPVIERAVYEGVARGVSTLLRDVSNFTKPDVVVETITQQVMNDLSEVVDFGQQALKFSPTLMAKMWQLAREEAEKEQVKPTELNVVAR